MYHFYNLSKGFSTILAKTLRFTMVLHISGGCGSRHKIQDMRVRDFEDMSKDMRYEKRKGTLKRRAWEVGGFPSKPEYPLVRPNPYEL